MQRASAPFALLLAMALVVAACGDDDDSFGIASTEGTSTSAAPTTEAVETTTTTAETAATTTTEADDDTDTTAAATSTTTTEAETTTTGGAGAPYSDFTRTAFMQGCEEGTNREFCECTLGELEAILTEDEFIDLGLELSGGGDPPQEIIDATFACLDLLDVADIDPGDLFGGDTGSQAGEGFSEATRSLYLEGCNDGTNAEFCECTIDEFEKVYTEEEFIALALQTTGEADLPQEFIDIALSCLP